MWSSICALRGHRWERGGVPFLECVYCGIPAGSVVASHRPRYRVQAWRVPNEDGADRPLFMWSKADHDRFIRTSAKLDAMCGERRVRSMADIIADQPLMVDVRRRVYSNYPPRPIRFAVPGNLWS